LENYPDDTLAPYQEFKLYGKTYYFTPGGFLCRKEPGTGALGGFFCGYLTDEVWHYRANDGCASEHGNFLVRLLGDADTQPVNGWRYRLCVELVQTKLVPFGQ